VNDRGSRDNWTWALLIGLLLMSACLAWHDLGAREVLGRDENATITKLDQPDLKAVLEVTYMKVTGQPGNMEPLYFLIQHLFWPLVGRSAFMLRFLSSAFALLAVALTYKLGEALLGRQAALIGALLTALLPLHLRYAQIARPYTLLAALSLASAYFLVRALQTNRARHWVGFVLSQALSFYTHYNALFVLAAEGLYTGIVWLTMLADVRRGRISARRLAAPILSFLALGALCMPGLVRLLGLPWMGLAEGDVPAANRAVELTLAFFRRFLYSAGLTTPWLQVLVVGFLVLGLAVLLVRRRWQAALFGVLWLAVPFAILAMIKSPRSFQERYVIFVTPVALLLAGEGVVSAGRAIGALGRRWRPKELRWAVTGVLTVGLALLFVVPLSSYYADNRAVDRLDQTMAIVEQHAQPGDVIIVSPRFLVRPLAANGAEVLYLTEHLTPAQFDALLARYQRAWVLYTSYLPPAALQEPLDQWIQARPDEFARVPIKAIAALAYSNRVLTGDEAKLQDRVPLLEELAGASADRQEAWLRYEVLAETYASLAELYAGRGEADRATEYEDRAEAARATAPRP
jgi:4-amino-4-deoxy-L-arabinose transferase-like glycosyltransferase